MNILQITTSGAKLCDECGDSAGVSLGFSLGQHLTLDFDLREAATGSGVLRSIDPGFFSGCRSFYFAMNNVWNATSAPLFLRTDGISLHTEEGKTFLSVSIPDTGTEALATALNGRANASFTTEIGGLDENGRAIFVWQFQILVGNRIYLGGDAPESVSGDPAYLTAAEVVARIRSEAENAAKNFEIGSVETGNAASVSLSAGTSADLALNFTLPAGAIVTGAGEVAISVDGNTATLVNTATGGTASVAVTGGTSIALNEAFLGVFGRCEYDLIDGDGFNISSSPEVSRRWNSGKYIITLASGFADGETYAAKPCGIKGESQTLHGSSSINIGAGGTVSVAVAPHMVGVLYDVGDGLQVNPVNLVIDGFTVDVERRMEVAVTAAGAIKNAISGGSASIYEAGNGTEISGSTISVPAFPGGAVSVTATGGTASVAISSGTKYVVSGEISSLVVSSVASSDRESVLTWTFADDASATVALPAALAVVDLPVFKAGRSYIASFRFGILVCREYNAGYAKRITALRSTGSQYIDTGIAGAAQMTVEIDFKAPTGTHLWGSRQLAEASQHLYNLNGRYVNQQMWVSRGGYGEQNISGDGTPFPLDTRAKFKVVNPDAGYDGKTAGYKDGVYTGQLSYNSPAHITEPIRLFGWNSHVAAQQYGAFTCYGFKIWSGGALVADYIPVLDFEGKAKMYDRVTNSYPAHVGEFEYEE